MPNQYLSIPAVCITQGGMCSTWSLVRTETHLGTKGKRRVGTDSCVKGQSKFPLWEHGEMRQVALQGEDHSLMVSAPPPPSRPYWVTRRKILRCSASKCVNSDGLMPKL